MLAFIFLVGAAYFVYAQLGGTPVLKVDRKAPDTTINSKIEELLEYAHRLRAANKYMAAEKVYLQILNLDHKHAVTYSKLGSLYVMMKNQADALECLQIASQLSPSAGSYYNLGLGYYENQNYIKAIAAFEKAIMFEPSAQRYVGAAKAYQKVSNHPKSIAMLELAVEIEPTERTLSLLAGALKHAGQSEEADIVRKRVEELQAIAGKPKRAAIAKTPTTSLENTKL